MYKVSRNDVKQLAAQIELLSKEVQGNIDNGGDFLAPANELVRNATTMIFALGEVFAVENGARKAGKIKSNTGSSGTKVYYRDACGRFASFANKV